MTLDAVKYLAPLLLLAIFAYVMLSANHDISSADARALVAKGAKLVDVRTPGEYAAGHIEGALNIPLQQLSGRLGEFGPKDTSIVLYCRSGSRSGRAKSILTTAGYTEVHNLGGKHRW